MKRLKLIYFIIVPILIIYLFFLAFDNRIEVTCYKLKNSHIKGDNIKIIHISDLHSTIHGDNQDILINKINEKNPDLILMTGDIADDYKPFEGTRLLLEGICKTAPIYYVTGNHEFWAKDYKDYIKKFKSYGVHVLEDRGEVITIKGTNILIYGVDDPDRYYQKRDAGDFKTALNTARERAKGFEGLRLLLSHRNEWHNTYKELGFDMVFSGHAHGGQGRIPFILPEGLVSPSMEFFPKYTGGIYDLGNNTTFIVSRGLSILNLPRIFNRPQLVYVEISK